MLHLIPPPAHRAGLRLAHAIRIRWWRIRRPVLSGCRVLVLDGEGRILLIRHSYGSRRWMLPGGGLGRREAPLAGAARELLEETACLLADAVLADLSHEEFHGAGNRIHVVVGRTESVPCADGREVVDASFFALDCLPDFLARGLEEAIPRWLTTAKAARQDP